jgi:hypothetical protein
MPPVSNRHGVCRDHTVSHRTDGRRNELAEAPDMQSSQGVPGGVPEIARASDSIETRDEGQWPDEARAG